LGPLIKAQLRMQSLERERETVIPTILCSV